MPAKRLLAFSFTLFAAIIVGVMLMRTPAESPQTIDEEQADTGMSAAARESLMRTIGYVQ
jgi:hypothetical protein